MKSIITLFLAALLACHPLLIQAQEQSAVSVVLDNDNIPVVVNGESASGALLVDAKPRKAKLVIGGGEYPQLELTVPVEEGQTTYVRGNVAEASCFPMMLTIDDFKERVAPELFYEEDDLLEETRLDTMSAGGTLGMMVVSGIALPIVLPLLAMSDVDDESTLDQTDNDDDTIKAMFWIGFGLGIVCILVGLAGFFQGRRHVSERDIKDNIEHNRQIVDMATQQAEKTNFQLVYEENGRRLETRNAAIAETFIQYRIGDGPWLDITPDLSAYSFEEDGEE